jgi:hypothetical protein
MRKNFLHCCRDNSKFTINPFKKGIFAQENLMTLGYRNFVAQIVFTLI